MDIRKYKKKLKIQKVGKHLSVKIFHRPFMEKVDRRCHKVQQKQEAKLIKFEDNYNRLFVYSIGIRKDILNISYI